MSVLCYILEIRICTIEVSTVDNSMVDNNLKYCIIYWDNHGQKFEENPCKHNYLPSKMWEYKLSLIVYIAEQDSTIQHILSAQTINCTQVESTILHNVISVHICHI